MVAYRVLTTLFVAALVCVHPSTKAQTPRPESDLLGTWILNVDSEPETRTLTITEVAPTSSGALLAAKYGITNKGQSPIEAKLSRVGEARQLNLVTQAATVIVVAEQPDGSFRGTFARKNGVVSEVTVARSAAAQSGAATPPPKDFTAIISPASDVPAECTAFHGVWSGKWAQGGFAEQYLRVLEVTKKDAGCVARLSYSSSKEAVPARSVVDLPIGASLTFVCNRSTGGTCVFKRVGNDLWASYSNSGGGSNSALFRRVPPQ